MNDASRCKYNRGFTLMELMIAVAIIGLIAAFAYPSYLEQATKSRRADGKSALMDAAARQERFYANNNTYTTSMTALGYAASPANSTDGYYSISAAAGPSGSIATSYALTATRQGAQASDAKCGNLTLNSQGVKGKTGTLTVADCW